MNINVNPNPNPRDQEYDIEFNNNSELRFDIKGTVIPRGSRNDINGIIKDPEEMIYFFYEQQSKGVRNNIQSTSFL